MMLKRCLSHAAKKLVLASKHVPSGDSSYHYYYIISRNGMQNNFCTQNIQRHLLRRDGVASVSCRIQLQLLALCLFKKCDINTKFKEIDTVKSNDVPKDPKLKLVGGGEDYKVLVICGPSGSGKSSLIERLFKEYPSKFGFSVSHTTRKPRYGEVHGEHYYFTTPEDMRLAIDRGEFLETATFSGHTYGTSFNSVRQVCRTGKVCILDIEMEGVKQVKQTDLDPILLFIKPPSMAELEKRLRARGTETEDSLNRRLNRAKQEMDYGEIGGNFHKVIINDIFDDAYKIFSNFIKNELLKRNVQLDSALE
ncbi:uncharacterized protein isoform X3 [Rhodnius prolixus]